MLFLYRKLEKIYGFADMTENFYAESCLKPVALGNKYREVWHEYFRI